VTDHGIDELKLMSELRGMVMKVMLREVDPSEAEAEIKDRIKESGDDPEMERRLRLALGEVYCCAKELTKSRAQYRKILDRDADCIEAMIHMGTTFMATSRFASADKWFQAAYASAERNGDQSGQLDALDNLAVSACMRDDWETLANRLAEMCEILAIAPPMEDLWSLMVPLWLFESNRYVLALPLVLCWITHALRYGYSRGPLEMPLQYFIAIERRRGKSDSGIWSMLDSLRSLAPDPSVASNVDIASDRAFYFNDRVPPFCLPDDYEDDLHNHTSR
jgi:hypothetical protein